MEVDQASDQHNLGGQNSRKPLIDRQKLKLMLFKRLQEQIEFSHSNSLWLFDVKLQTDLLEVIFLLPLKFSYA